MFGKQEGKVKKTGRFNFVCFNHAIPSTALRLVGGLLFLFTAHNPSSPLLRAGLSLLPQCCPPCPRCRQDWAVGSRQGPAVGIWGGCGTAGAVGDFKVRGKNRAAMAIGGGGRRGAPLPPDSRLHTSKSCRGARPLPAPEHPCCSWGVSSEQDRQACPSPARLWHSKHGDQHS